MCSQDSASNKPKPTGLNKVMQTLYDAALVDYGAWARDETWPLHFARQLLIDAWLTDETDQDYRGFGTRSPQWRPEPCAPPQHLSLEDGKKLKAHVLEVRHAFDDALEAKTIPCWQGKDGKDRVNARDVVQWAVGRGYPIPTAFEDPTSPENDTEEHDSAHEERIEYFDACLQGRSSWKLCQACFMLLNPNEFHIAYEYVRSNPAVDAPDFFGPYNSSDYGGLVEDHPLMRAALRDVEEWKASKGNRGLQVWRGETNERMVRPRSFVTWAINEGHDTYMPNAMRAVADAPAEPAPSDDAARAVPARTAWDVFLENQEWSLYEAVELVLGYLPRRPGHTQPGFGPELNDRYHLYGNAADAIREGALPGRVEEQDVGRHVEYASWEDARNRKPSKILSRKIEKRCFVKSVAFLKWVQEAGYLIPDELRGLLGEAPAEAAPGGDASPQAPSDNKEPQQEYVFGRDNDFWRIVFQGRELPSVKHMDGMTYIACLLRTPGRSVSVLELHLEAKGGQALVPGEPEKAITDVALQKAHEEVRALNEEIDDAEKYGHTDRQREAQEDKDRILKELNKVTDRSGKPRMLSAERERLRKCISQAIGRALDAIEKADREISNHFRNNIQLGNSPMYRPNIPWTVSCH